MSAELPTRHRPVTPHPPPAPDPERLARLLVRVWFEVQAGRRPFSQLAPLVSPALRRRLLSQLPRRHPGRPPLPAATIRRVVVDCPRDEAYELCVLVERADRVTAVALRLERRHGAWRAVDMTAPESGLQPLLSVPRTAPPPRDAFDEVLEGW